MFWDDKTVSPHPEDDKMSSPPSRIDRIQRLLRLKSPMKGTSTALKLSHNKDQDSPPIDQSQLQPQQNGDVPNVENTHQTHLSGTDFDSIENLYSEEDLNRLGKQRPTKFDNAWSELAYCFCICMSQVLAEYFISGFTVIVPTLVEEFDIPEASAVWPASAFSLVVASVLLFFGKVADMYGGYPVYILGMVWLSIWSIIAGFSKNRIMLIICRALQGLGPAAYLPASLMLMSNIYRPGPRKNLVFSIYGTCAVLGFFIGILFAGLSAQLLNWSWYFWIGAILAAFTAFCSYFAIPSDMGERKHHDIKMDYLGTLLILSGLTLSVFALTDSAHAAQGWKTPYILVCFILGCLILIAAFYVEGWVAADPVLPFDMFDAPSIKPLMVSLLFFYGCLGVFLLYGTLYMINIMGASTLKVVLWCLPLLVGGIIFPISIGTFLHNVSGTKLLLISGLGWIISGILFAAMPENVSYWRFVFPAMIGCTLGIDITYNITNIYITSCQSTSRQGLAGAIINSALHLSIAVLLGFADIAQVATSHLGQKESYQVTFWFHVGCAIVSFLIIAFWVRVPPASSELTADEKRVLAEELRQRREGGGSQQPTASGQDV